MTAHRPEPSVESRRPDPRIVLGALTASALQTLAQAAAMSGLVFPPADAYRDGHGR